MLTTRAQWALGLVKDGQVAEERKEDLRAVPPATHLAFLTLLPGALDI